MRMPIRVAVALAVGLVSGLAVLLGYLAFQASVQAKYVHAWGELMGVPALLVILAPAVLVVASFRLRGGVFWRGLGLLMASLAAGTLLGAVGGATLTPHPSGPWAGGMMGAAGAILLAFLVLGARSLTSSRAATVILLTTLTAACRPAAEPAPDEARVVPFPDSSAVESVVFLLGDPGMARMETSPVLQRMRLEVETWSERLGPEGEVRMVVMGDILYPDGLNSRTAGEWRHDSLRVSSQIRVVGGPAAETVGARGLFLPGNHDWGREEDWAGARRLVRLQEFLWSWEGEGAGRVELHPVPGTGGPSVVDLGEELRLVLLDTAWWLLGREPGEEEEFLSGIREALETAGDRRVVVAAHHPLESGGPHGLGVDLGSFLGIRLLLKRAGILLQDLDSRPYSEFKSRLLEIFIEVRRPDVFAGGHEHSLQIFSSESAGGRRGVVVGSASKLTGVSMAPGMLFGRSEPGYGTIMALEDGSLHIRLEATPVEFLSCQDAVAENCIERGVESFRTVWSETLEWGEGS